MTTRGSQNITYDVENRPVSVTGGASFVYDGNGNRVMKTEGGQTTVYINQYYEKNVTTGNITTSYYLGSKLIAQRQGSTLNYVLQDSLGSTSVIADSSGTSAGTIQYFPFGSVRFSTGTISTDKKFTGQRLDLTGLYYYNARYYDANIGRFISPDTIISNPSDPQSLNRYSYVLNNSLKYTDPTGNWPDWGKIGSFFKGVGKAILVKVYVALQVIIDPNARTNMIISSLLQTVTPGVQDQARYDYYNSVLQSDPNSSEAWGYITGDGATEIALFVIGFKFGGEIDSSLGAIRGSTIRPTQKGIDIISNHLGQFGNVPENTFMLQRINAKLSSGGVLTYADANFYAHELEEAALMAKGVSQGTAHENALSLYGLCEWDLYDPAAVKAADEVYGQKSMNPAYYQYWGIK
jgi:RHS repeat-associated protein